MEFRFTPRGNVRVRHNRSPRRPVAQGSVWAASPSERPTFHKKRGAEGPRGYRCCCHQQQKRKFGGII